MTVVCRPGGAQTGPRSSFPLILTCGAPKHSCFLASRPLLLPPCSRAVGLSLLHAAERRHVQLHLVFPCRPGIFREGTRYFYLEILSLQLRGNIYCMCIRYIRSWALEALRQTRHGPFSERARCSLPLPGNSSLGCSCGSLLTLLTALGCLGSTSDRRCSLNIGPESRPQLPGPAWLCLPPAALMAAGLSTCQLGHHPP